MFYENVILFMRGVNMASTIKVTREQIFKELWDTDAVRLCKKFDISLETLNRA